MQEATITTKRKHTGGRPEKSAEERRCIRVQPSFTLSEFDSLEQRAARAGLETSEWLRVAGLGILIKSTPTLNRKDYSELANLASNISKITSQILTTGQTNNVDLTNLLMETRNKVQALRAELIGSASS